MYTCRTKWAATASHSCASALFWAATAANSDSKLLHDVRHVTPVAKSINNRWAFRSIIIRSYKGRRRVGNAWRCSTRECNTEGGHGQHAASRAGAWEGMLGHAGWNSKAWESKGTLATCHYINGGQVSVSALQNKRQCGAEPYTTKWCTALSGSLKGIKAWQKLFPLLSKLHVWKGDFENLVYRVLSGIQGYEEQIRQSVLHKFSHFSTHFRFSEVP